MKPFENLHDYSELIEEIDKDEMPQANAIGEFMVNLLKLKPHNYGQVIDFGCASGLYLLPFKKAGFNVLGVDSCANAGKLIGSNFKRVDLRFPYIAHNPIVWLLALSLETAEHIDPEFEETYLDNVCQAANILFCAAQPGQGGENHVNEQPKSHWIEQFKKRGYEIHPDNFKLLEHLRNEVYDKCGWLRKNAILFRKERSARCPKVVSIR